VSRWVIVGPGAIVIPSPPLVRSTFSIQRRTGRRSCASSCHSISVRSSSSVLSEPAPTPAMNQLSLETACPSCAARQRAGDPPRGPKGNGTPRELPHPRRGTRAPRNVRECSTGRGVEITSKAYALVPFRGLPLLEVQPNVFRSFVPALTAAAQSRSPRR